MAPDALPVKQSMSQSLLSQHLRPGDRVFVGQAAGEPVGLVAELFDSAPGLGSVEVFCGLSFNPAWGGTVPDAVHVTTYCGLGTIQKLVAGDRTRVVPASLSHLSSMITSGKLPVDVVLLQVSPADADGYHSLGCTLDYVWEAALKSRTVLVEVNTSVPVTRGTARFHQSDAVVVRHSDTPLPRASADAPGEVQRQIAAQVAKLVPDGATLKLGIGGLPTAVAEALSDHRGLNIRSGIVGDWFLDLLKTALDRGSPDACLASLAVGSQRLYDFLSRKDILKFAPPATLVVPITGSPLMAINSAIEVDLRGPLNAEFLGQRYVGTIGGQTDYFRAARQSSGGLAILALPATSSSGKSRIVPRCHHVTTPQSEVDVIVTEHSAADLRGTTLIERMELISKIAGPQHRDALRSDRGSDTHAEPK
jgi:acyl-CoA hydrolase